MSLYVISGPMFSGKTQELLRLFTRQHLAKKSCVLFKPKEDTRINEFFTRDSVCSRAGSKIECEILNTPDQLDKHLNIFIDEAWLLSEVILTKILERAFDVDIYCTVLNRFADGGQVPVTMSLLHRADEVISCTNICNWCGNSGSYTFSQDNGPQVKLGDDGYLGSCGKCWRNHNVEKQKIQDQSQVS